MERWKIIPGHPKYEVSDHGRVRRKGYARQHGAGYVYPRLLKPFALNREGHLAVSLTRKHPNIYVHRLVMEAFVGPCPDGMEVCHHPDDDPSNNRLDNLMYGTHHENMQQSSRLRPVRRSDGKEFISAAEAGRQTGVTRQSICAVCRGKHKTTSGFGWEYI